MKKKLLMGIVAVVLFAGGGVANHFLLGPNPAEAAKEATPPGKAAIVEMDPLVTNIANDRRARVQVALAVAPIERAKQVQADPLLVARLRDKILTMLTGRAYEELSSPSGKEDFRQKIRIEGLDNGPVVVESAPR